MRGRGWIVAGLVALVFAPALIELSRVWSAYDYYSHGWLVPAVSGWIAWTRRAALRALPPAGDRRGIGVLAGALVVYALGLLLSSPSLQGLALVAAVAGAVLGLRGAAALRALAFPVGFLLFMVPLPEAWLRPAILELRLWVTGSSVFLLQAAGVAVTRSGNVIGLPDGSTLFVADACSGVTSVVTLAPLGVLFAAFTVRGWAARAVLVASVVPIAMLGNLLRVVLTVVAAQRIGAAAATEASLHESAGVLIYVLGCLVLVALGQLLRRLWPETKPA